MKKKILIVEDEKNLMKVLYDTIIKENIEIIQAYDGEDAIDKFYEYNPDLILLDINLPKKNGWEVCKEIRETSDKSIIMMTARDTELDEVKGLKLGADDYITKPFSLQVLLIKIKKILKLDKQMQYSFEDFTINFNSGILIIEEQHIEITKKEIQFLSYMIENKNNIIERIKLLDEIWGYDYEGDDRVVDTLVKRVRKKMNQYAFLIKTVRGLGYVFSENKN